MILIRRHSGCRESPVYHAERQLELRADRSLLFFDFPKWIVRAILSVFVTSEKLQYYIYGLDDRNLLSPLLSIGISVTAWIFTALWWAVRRRDARQELNDRKLSVSGAILSVAFGFGASQLVMVFCLLFSG